MARRRFQKPTPFKEGKYWWLRRWSSDPTDSRKRERIKLAEADLPLREVQKIADDLLRPMNQGCGLRGSAMRLSDFMDQTYIPRFLEDRRRRYAVSRRLRKHDLAVPSSPHRCESQAAELASSTRDCYWWMIAKHVRPDLGSNILRQLTRSALQEYFAQKAREVSYPTMSKIRDVLSSVLRCAVEVEYLNKNPLEGLRLPKDRRARRLKATITPEEFASLVRMVAEPYATMIFTAVWTGLRVSELIGLKWRCIHGDSITIEERYCRGDWANPKSNASAATIGVEPEVIARLLRLKNLLIEIRAGRAIRRYKAVKSAEPDDLVFQSVRTGQPMNDHNILKRHVQPAARKLGLPFVDWRCLRRSHATWLVQAGADPKSVQGQMRHSRVSTTLGIYAQVVPAAQRLALQQLSAFAGAAGVSEAWPESRSKTVQ